MTEVVSNQARSRSDSFQRMLDLEKKMMLHRREGSTSNSHHSTPTGSVPPSPLPQPRRFELVPKDGKKAPPPPVRNYGPLHPQLFTSSTAPVNADADPSAAIKRKPVAHARSVSMSITMMEKAPPQKNVAFAFPPGVQERRAVSQSPALVQEKKGDKEDRREVKKEPKKEPKQEPKKEDKKKEEEKKGKEPASKEKPRGRRLSKAPPTYLTPSVQGRTATEPVKEKSRSSSLLGISIGRRDTAKDEPAEKPKRGRSGSLTSVIRGSFEIRRGSWDQTSASGFLGGVKLEKKKQDFTQQVLDDQAKGSSSVHPALRKSFLGHGSFTPLKASPEPEKDADAQRRAYPPISINNAGGMNSTASSPNTPKTHSRRGSSGSSNIYLWSARARKKFFDQSDECAVADDEDESEQQIKNDSPVDPPSMPKESIGLTRRGGVHIKNVSSRGAITPKFQTELETQTGTTEPEVVKPLKISKTDIPKIKTTAPEPEPEPTKETIMVHKNDENRSPTSPKSLEQRVSRVFSPSPKPPAPPRKSSKRHSTPPLSRSQTAPMEGHKDDSSRTSKESTRSDKNPLASIKPSSVKRNPIPPSIRYETTMAGVRPTPYSGGSPTNSSTNWSPTKPIGSSGNSSESLSPVSTSGRFSPSPLKTEIVAPLAADADFSTQTPDNKRTSANKKTSHPSAERLDPMKMAHPALRRPRTSSSDESLYSDALQTTSGLDTPDTSPPQSDSGYKLNGEKRMTQYSPYWSMENSPEMASTDRFQVSDAPNSEDEVDPIEAAARRVMEAFSNANLRSPALSHKEDSSGDSSMPSTPITPIMETQPRLRHKDKSKGRLRPANIHTVRLSQTANGPKAVRSTPNLDVRGHKSGQPASEGSNQSKPNPQRGEKVGKVFVVCCECKRYHDIPTKLYKTMLNPGHVFDQPETKGFEDRVCMTVKCSWCDHLMSTKCCPGVSSILEVQARVH